MLTIILIYAVCWLWLWYELETAPLIEDDADREARKLLEARYGQRPGNQI